MPPTGRPGSMPAKRFTDWRATARIMRLVALLERLISISASSSGVMASMAPPPPAAGPRRPGRPGAVPSARRWPRPGRCRGRASTRARGSEKYTSNTVSKARQCELFFTSVAASAYLNASRSSSGMCWTASMASRFSVRLTGSPASRSSWMNPASSSLSAEPAPISASLRRDVARRRRGAAPTSGGGVGVHARTWCPRARAAPWRCRTGT